MREPEPGVDHITITAPVLSRSHGVWRVSAYVDDNEIWFESADVPLTPAPEAHACAMLIPSLLLRRSMRLQANVCRAWQHGAGKIAATVGNWWDGDTTLPELTTEHRSAIRSSRIGQCFSAGVDSFYSLLRIEPRPDYLVSFLGYDIQLNDWPRLADYEKAVRAVAQETGCTAVFIRSNIRQHPTFSQLDWKRSHGGALAAGAHLLSGCLGALRISASYANYRNIPWGTRWDIDPHFSSANVRIEHVGSELQRSNKLKQIAEEPLVRKHLRVCWEGTGSTANCCVCEKCVRTMLTLTTVGQLPYYPTFRHGDGLLTTIEAMPQLTGTILSVYENMLTRPISEPYKSALRRLLTRSGRPLWRRIAARVKRRLLQGEQK